MSMTPPVRATAWRAGGELGPYIGDPGEKAQRLAEEGVAVQEGAVDLEQFGFCDFRSDRPLQRLREIQKRPTPNPRAAATANPKTRWRRRRGLFQSRSRRGRLRLGRNGHRPTRLVCHRSPPRHVSVHQHLPELPRDSHSARLARQGPRGRATAQVLLVDGSGILHQRRAGIASHLGVVPSLPTSA